METCCATEECVNKSNDAVFEHHREVPARAGVGWKLKWTDPGPEVKVIHAVVPGPFEGLKILKALPYKVVSKCGSCAVQNRRRLRNGIPDPWLEYLEHDAWLESQEGDEVSEERNDVSLVKKCLKITDFVWQKKGLALLQGIPDPWKSDLPCECEIKKESKNKKEKSHDEKFARRRSSTNKRDSPRRRSSMNEDETLRRKSTSEEESPTRRVSPVHEEEPLRHQNANHKEKSSSHRSTINEEFSKRRSSNKREETTKRRSKNYDEAPVRRRSKSEDKIVKRAMCYAVEPSKTAYVRYGGIVPACLRDCIVEEQSKRQSKYHERKSIKCRSNRYDEEPIRRSSKKYNREVPAKGRNKNYDEEPTKCRSYENENIEDCLKICKKLAECRKKRRQESQSKTISKNKKKEPTANLWDTANENSSEVSVETLKKSRKRSDIANYKVEKEKTAHSVKKLRTCGSGFDKVKQRLQELENDLKAKEAAKELKLREMEQLAKLRKKACKGNKRSGKVREKFGKQQNNGWADDPDEPVDKIRSTCKESISPRGNYCLKAGEYSVRTDRCKSKIIKDQRMTTNSKCCDNKNVIRWLDEPVIHKKKLSKESSKSANKIEAPSMASYNTREFKTPQTPIKRIRKDTGPATARPCSPQPTISTCAQPAMPRTHYPFPANPRRVSYTDEPQPSSRTCSPCSPNHRRVSYCDELQPPTSRRSSPYCRGYREASYVDEPVTPRNNLSKSSIVSPKESKESLKKFLEEINSRIEITQGALNSPCMKSVAVQPFHEETSKTWHCPGRALCPKMRERAGGDEGSELFVRRIRVSEAADKDANDGVELEGTLKIDEKSVEDHEDSDASVCNAGADRAYLQRSSYRRCSMADFKRREKEIEELYVESFSEHDC